MLMVVTDYTRRNPTSCELAGQLEGEADPVEALRRWLRSNVEFVATKKGMSATLALAAHGSPELHGFAFERLTRAAARLLERAVAAGAIRSDVTAEDLLRTVIGMCLMHDRPAWQTGVLRMIDVLIDGLRVRAVRKPKRLSRRAAAGSVAARRQRR